MQPHIFRALPRRGPVPNMPRINPIKLIANDPKCTGRKPPIVVVLNDRAMRNAQNPD